MALGDKFLFEVAKKAVLCELSNDLDTLRYRQHILKDCLKNPSIVRAIYHIMEKICITGYSEQTVKCELRNLTFGGYGF
jgi:hypothetical protein